MGWFLVGPGYLLEEKEQILKTHIDNFAGSDKTLLTFDNMEKEEAFHFYENNRLVKQDGYYIYYEKNEEMQTYIIEHNKPESREADYDDRVSREIRTVIQNKKPVPVQENKSVSRLIYAAGTLLAVIILIVGAAMLSNYDQMKNMQKALDSLSRNLEEVNSAFDKKDPAATENKKVSGPEKTDTTKEVLDKKSEDSLDINVVPGEVKPLERDEASDDKKEQAKEEDQDTTAKDDQGEASSHENDETAEAKEVKYYTVVSGDSLAGISYKLYNSANYISVIKRLNQIENEDMIYIGQKLIVP